MLKYQGQVRVAELDCRPLQGTAAVSTSVGTLELGRVSQLANTMFRSEGVQGVSGNDTARVPLVFVEAVSGQMARAPS